MQSNNGRSSIFHGLGFKILVIAGTLLIAGTRLDGQELNRNLEAQSDVWLVQRVTALVARIKETEGGRNFLENHSEADLRKLILFLQEPLRRFDSIHDIPDPCSYFWAIQEYFIAARKEALETRLRDFFGFISEDFQKVDRRNISMLTHFLMTCHSGIICEALADRYTRLFGADPEPFLEDLERRENWKDIIRQLEGGDWQELKIGLSKLGSSAFECELKAFVSSLEKEVLSSHLRDSRRPILPWNSAQHTKRG